MEKENVIQKIQKLLKIQYGAESIGSTGRGMFKDDGKKCKNHTFRSDHFCEQTA